MASRRLLLVMLLLAAVAGWPASSRAVASGSDALQPVRVEQEGSAERLMQRYTEQQDEVSEQRRISIQSKHEVLFWMGAGLLVGLLLTTFFGVGTGVLGKDWFVPHMICAGLTVTLGIAHAVTAFVWFWPY